MSLPTRIWLALLPALLFCACTKGPSEAPRPTAGGEGVLGYIIRDPGGIRLERTSGNLRVIGGSGAVQAIGGGSAADAHVTVYDVTLTDVQDLLNSREAVVALSPAARKITEFRPEANGSFDRSVSYSPLNDFVLLAVAAAPQTYGEVTVAHHTDSDPTTAFQRNDSTDSFQAVFRRPFPEKGFEDPQTLPVSAPDNRKPALALDASGNATAVWVGESNGEYHVTVSRREAGAWAGAVTLASYPTGSGVVLDDVGIAASESGPVAVTWEVCSAGTCHAYLARYFDSGSGYAWSSVVSLATVANARDPHAALDGQGNLGVVFVDEENYQSARARFVSCPAGGFCGEAQPLGQAMQSNYVSTPRIAFYGTQTALAIWREASEIKGSRWVSGSWSTPSGAYPDSNPIEWLSLGVLSSGEGVIVRTNQSAGGAFGVAYTFNFLSSGSFTSFTQLGTVDRGPRLAVNGERAILARVAVETGTETVSTLKVRRFHGGNWGADASLTGGVVGHAFDLGGVAIDKDGNALVAAAERAPGGSSTDVIMHRLDISGGWAPDVIGTVGGAFGLFSPRVAILPQTLSPYYEGLGLWTEGSALHSSAFR